MRQPTHIGIVAVSAEGAALCYRTICAAQRRAAANPDGGAVAGGGGSADFAAVTDHVVIDPRAKAGALESCGASILPICGAGVRAQGKPKTLVLLRVSQGPLRH